MKGRTIEKDGPEPVGECGVLSIEWADRVIESHVSSETTHRTSSEVLH